ncbi:ATP-binding cassette domain-containing protein [Flavobacteriaceae bacterium]|nr:ATP-binding cassette domain-containing protein [Flavobacteriaceae bacterium]
MNPIVFLKNVNISQNNTSVLSNINLSVNKGEFIYFIGKTGVGKSSLLRILYGDIIVKEGEARILDTNLTKLKDKEIPFLRRKLGVVFQDFKLLPNKTIKKILNLFLEQLSGTIQIK